MECEFCQNEIKDPYSEVCPECKFPFHGSEETKEQFKNDNEQFGKLINEAESALSWARFGMFWPWLTILIAEGFEFLQFPRNLTAFFSTLTICCVFAWCYMSARKNPVSALIIAFVFLCMLTLYGLVVTKILFSIPIYWAYFLIPAILLLMFGNALYLQTKLKKEFSLRNR